MPAHYAIDLENRIVRTTFSGVIIHNDPIEHSRKLSKDPAFDPSFSELIEFEEVSDIEVNMADLLGLLGIDPFSQHSRRAFVIGSRNVIYGIVRMYEILRSDTPCVKIFETRDEALPWLISASHRVAG
jgi:hypothetical protein